MVILFSLIVMRMSGAIVFNPILGRTNIPRTAKAILIFSLSVLLYMGTDGVYPRELAGMMEYGFLLLKELMIGFVLGYSMELAFMIIRFASAIMDSTMGLSMAQVYDPQYNTQMTITTGLYYTFLALLFLAGDGHVHLISIFFSSAQFIPFGEVVIRPELYELVLDIFKANVAMGLQFAFPLLAIELVTESAVGILMRMIPQINVFAVNFQIKIIVGLMMLFLMFNPMSDRLYLIIDNMFLYIEQLLNLMVR